jgi:hypothetical protein
LIMNTLGNGTGVLVAVLGTLGDPQP